MPPYNWLCSAAVPAYNVKLSAFVRPLAGHEKIHVLHLTSSGTMYDGYKRAKMDEDIELTEVA